MRKTVWTKSFFITFGGIIIGIVLFFLWRNAILVNSRKIFGEIIIWKQYTEINKVTYLLFLLQYRTREIILFFLLCGIWNRRVASKIFLFFMGIYFGILGCIGISLYGVLGILFTLCIYFPHGLCYFTAMILLDRNDLKPYVYWICGMLTIIGILFEVYVNLKIFFKFLKILKIL